MKSVENKLGFIKIWSMRIWLFFQNQNVFWLPIFFYFLTVQIWFTFDSLFPGRCNIPNVFAKKSILNAYTCSKIANKRQQCLKLFLSLKVCEDFGAHIFSLCHQIFQQKNPNVSFPKSSIKIYFFQIPLRAIGMADCSTTGIFMEHVYIFTNRQKWTPFPFYAKKFLN